ncbi:thymidylate kinase [Acrasis kona]|uniref:Thymidylate kinase n=1 Tax=Acrasis kona TaxID=1008807 RepID=A0AAW2ZK38_9EUKA
MRRLFRTNVIAIEGVHGSGKSSLCEYIKKFHSEQFYVLDEAFLNDTTQSVEKSTPFHPQSLIMETMWTCRWFTRILEHREASRGRTIIVDRSPYSAMAYVRPSEPGRDILKPLIKDSLRELRESHNVNLKTIYLRVQDTDVLYRRITERLNEARQELNEGSKQHLLSVHNFYESMMSDTWDYVVSNELQDITNLNKVYDDFNKCHSLVACK